MTDMVERVALAIKSKVPFGYGMTDAETLEYARAAIEAMREPTEAMLDEGHNRMDFDDSLAPDADQYNRSVAGLARAITAMIDAALGEGSK